MRPVIIIPSRLGSTRLPNKPLADICGLPMIVQVYNRALEADIADIYVAAAEQEIIDAVQDNGGKAILTDPNLPSGSDRIAQALNRIDGDYDAVINLQGDLPTIEPHCVREVYQPLLDGAEMSTLACKISDEDERTNPNIVKAVVGWENETYGKALYFTRATAPYGEGDLYHHIGIYGYRADTLKKFVSLPPSPLEIREKLEQLRALENNIAIDVVATNTIPLGVDVESDLIKARKILCAK